MSDFNENMDYGTEMAEGEGLSKEDLAGAGLIGVAMIVGIGAYEGGKKGIHKLGEFLDEKDKNPITKIKKRRMEKKLEREVKKAALQEAYDKKMAEVQAAAKESEK